MSVTILEILVQRLRATADGYHAGAEEAPVAILWTDPDGVWTPVVVQLQGLMPELLMLGDYAPQERKGPVIWLKCAIAGTIKEVEIPKTVVPVLYLPGVARHHLRAADQCSPELQPLVELLYRGTIWTHPNGRDWTLEAFFQADEGLGLDVAGDEKTRDSLRAAITMLAKTPVDQLRNKGRLESADFDDIVVGDTPRDLLTWLGSPDTVRKEWGEERWHAFRSRCRDKYEFDPEKEPPLYAAERLGRREADAWRQLWGRFCEAPGLYSGVRVALDQAQPSDILALDPESWPAENEKQENELRTALSSLEQKAPHTARHELNHLEKEHAPRRSWVWAKLDEAPLSRSMAALHQLAEATRTVPTCATADELVTWYVEQGWKADAAALAALRSLHRAKDVPALHAAIRSVYAPWLEELTRKYQALVAAHGYIFPAGETAAEGECLLFVDGLRFDVGQELAERLLEIVPERAKGRVWLGHSGSDANETVARAVVAATGRPRIISYKGAYHGGTSGSMAISGHPVQQGVPKAAGLTLVTYPNAYRDGGAEAAAGAASAPPPALPSAAHDRGAWLPFTFAPSSQPARVAEPSAPSTSAIAAPQAPRATPAPCAVAQDKPARKFVTTGSSALAPPAPHAGDRAKEAADSAASSRHLHFIARSSGGTHARVDAAHIVAAVAGARVGAPGGGFGSLSSSSSSGVGLGLYSGAQLPRGTGEGATGSGSSRSIGSSAGVGAAALAAAIKRATGGVDKAHLRHKSAAAAAVASASNYAGGWS